MKHRDFVWLVVLWMFEGCCAFVVRLPTTESSSSSKGRRRSIKDIDGGGLEPRRVVHTALYGMQVNIRLVGRKGAEQWIEEAVEVYQKRLKAANVDLRTEWYKSDHALIKSVAGDYHKRTVVILLDPHGQTYSSEELASSFYDWMEQGGSRLSFVIGGAEGLPEELRRPGPLTPSPKLISLSRLTFTHQFARLLLVEQIYRASEIRKGSDYHK